MRLAARRARWHFLGHKALGRFVIVRLAMTEKRLLAMTIRNPNNQQIIIIRQGSFYYMGIGIPDKLKQLNNPWLKR